MPEIWRFLVLPNQPKVLLSTVGAAHGHMPSFGVALLGSVSSNGHATQDRSSRVAQHAPKAARGAIPVPSLCISARCSFASQY